MTITQKMTAICNCHGSPDDLGHHGTMMSNGLLTMSTHECSGTQVYVIMTILTSFLGVTHETPWQILLVT
jgi:hypothetical protein